MSILRRVLAVIRGRAVDQELDAELAALGGVMPTALPYFGCGIMS
ncbi:MAG: hypothetical protein ACKV2U_17640 [Bryobacteraceae bacterium]